MILRDRVDLLDPRGELVQADVPAHVAYRRTLAGDGYSDSFYIKEQLTVLLSASVPVELPGVSNDGSIFVWRGEQYLIDTPPEYRRKHGRDHHQTIGLKRFG